MTRPFSLTYKQKMLDRLSGKDAISARQLSFETGVRQQTLSRWLLEAGSVPPMSDDQRSRPKTIDERLRILTATSALTGAELARILQREGVLLAELEQWRLALADDGRGSVAMARRIRALERELLRKERALAEAAALLVLKKKVTELWAAEDDDTPDASEP